MGLNRIGMTVQEEDLQISIDGDYLYSNNELILGTKNKKYKGKGISAGQKAENDIEFVAKKLSEKLDSLEINGFTLKTEFDDDENINIKIFYKSVSDNALITINISEKEL